MTLGAASAARRRRRAAIGVALAALLACAPGAAAAPQGAVGGVRDPAAGTLELSVHATESTGAGLRRAAVTLGGQALDARFFGAADCGPGTCPALGVVALSVPTVAVADGAQRLEVTAEDGNGQTVHLLDRTITVANARPPQQASVTLTVQAGGAAAPGASGTPPPDRPARPACRAPRLSAFLRDRALRIRRAVPVLAADRAYRFAGRLTCRIGGRRRAAPAGTPIGLRHDLPRGTRTAPALRADAGGRFAVRLRLRSSRVVVFRARAASGAVVRVRIPVRVQRGHA